MAFWGEPERVMHTYIYIHIHIPALTVEVVEVYGELPLKTSIPLKVLTYVYMYW
jgi:hypothetical protein